MKAVIFFTCAVALIAMASASCPDLSHCDSLRCSHVATKVYYRDASNCWTCKCENETPAPTDDVTTVVPTTLPPTGTPKKITHLRDMCVTLAPASEALGANRFYPRNIREGEDLDGKFLAWLRPRQCGPNGEDQCWRVRSCEKAGAYCQVMEACLATDEGCIGLLPRYCDSIPTDFDCNEDGIPDIEQDTAEVIYSDAIDGTICAWVTDPDLSADFFIKKLKASEPETSLFSTPFGGIKMVGRSPGPEVISYNFKINPADTAACAVASEIVFENPSGDIAVDSSIGQFKDDACRFKVKVADNSDLDSNSNSDIVNLEFYVGQANN